jgi:hypothetical protein
MHAWWGLLSADDHRGDRRRSSLLQMPVSMGNCYYYSFDKYVSRMPLQLTGHTYCSLPSLKKAVSSLGGSILDQFIRIRVHLLPTQPYLHSRKEVSRVTRKTKTTTTTMMQVHRRHFAMIHIAHDLMLTVVNNCWHFLASLPRIEFKLYPQQWHIKCLLVFINLTLVLVVTS